MASKTAIIAAFALFVVLNLTFVPFISATNPTNPLPRCPIDALKLSVCADLLNGLVGVRIGTPPRQSCCSLLQGLADLDAAVCLCTALKADVLGIHLNVPLSLSLILNACGCNIPPGFNCT